MLLGVNAGPSCLASSLSPCSPTARATLAKYRPPSSHDGGLRCRFCRETVPEVLGEEAHLPRFPGREADPGRQNEAGRATCGPKTSKVETDSCPGAHERSGYHGGRVCNFRDVQEPARGGVSDRLPRLRPKRSEVRCSIIEGARRVPLSD